MSKLTELLEIHCPNGVEYKKLGDLGIFENIGVDKKTVEGQPLVSLLNYVDVYKKNMDLVFGTGSCNVLKIRKYGGVQVI